MCGIAGAAWSERGSPLPDLLLRRMTDAIRHRGPDDDGFFRRQDACGGVALGHRRLSIIDVEGGHQPISNEDGTVWTVFNGEIYNFQELHRQLVQSGHVFRTATDTEILVHLYEDHGEACVERLRGMFAFAIWDDRQRRLFIARDRLGKKPLFYHLHSERLLFGSELKSLLQVPDVQRELDPQALDQYLRFLYIPHPRSIFRGIMKLPPGHCATFENGRLTLRRYWELDYSEDTELSAADQCERLRETLTEATRLRMISDVPLGAFLSGGIDSSAIVGLMSQLSSSPVKAFSMGFSVAEFDETDYARQAASRFGVEHQVFRVTPDLMDVIPKLVSLYDEPYADSSAIPTYYLAQHTRQAVKVALTGDGGDELFAGYDWYATLRIHQWLDRLPSPLRRVVAARLWQRLPSANEQNSKLRRVKAVLQTLSLSPERRFLQMNRAFSDSLCKRIYTDEFQQTLTDHEPAELVFESYGRSEGRDAITRATFADIASYLPGDILTKVDIASMAHGLECRSPFMDHHVVQLAARMPIELKLQGLRRKRILRKAFPELLPDSMWKRKKMGFCLPLREWFRGPLKEFSQAILFDPGAFHRSYLSDGAVQQLFDEHLDKSWDHSTRLWALVMLELWHRSNSDRANSQTDAGKLRKVEDEHVHVG